MALSQKHVGKMLVPWFNSNEWKYVHGLIFGVSSSEADKLRALDLLRMWKARTPRLPRGIEGTLAVLDALLQDQCALSEEKLRILYGAAIVRFLNLCGASADRQGTFYKTAKQNGIPDWLVDLRHDISHDQVIPSKSMLLTGLKFCLDWLKSKYWDKQKLTLKDFIISTDYKTEISNAIALYGRLNLLQNLNEASVYVEDIISIEPSLANFAIQPTMEVEYALKLTLQELTNCLTCHNDEATADFVADCIIKNGDIFSWTTESCVGIWQDLIDLLCRSDALFAFLKALYSYINRPDVTEHNKRNASIWLRELSRSLLLAKKIAEKYDGIPVHGDVVSETAEVVLWELAIKENPVLKGALHLDSQLCESVIHSFCSLQKEIMHNPTEFLLIYLRSYLQVCGCSDEYITELEKVVKLFLHCEDAAVDLQAPLRTLEDFPELAAMRVEGNDAPEHAICMLNEKVNSGQQKKRRWRLLEDKSMIEGCPLGVLAFQSRDANPLLQDC